MFSQNIRVFSVIVGLLSMSPCTQAKGLFAAGDVAQGKALHSKSCQACHDNMYADKKGDTLYSPDFRKMKDANSLQQRVTACAGQFNAGWFEEEVESVSRYLNDTFYHFKP